MSTVCKRKLFHSIDIFNLKDGEVVNHSVLLVKGRITQPCIESKIKLCVEEKTVTTHVSRTSTGEYKFLLDLRCYEKNIHSIALCIKLYYCNTERAINIFYENNSTKYRVQPLYIICSDEKKRIEEQETAHICQIIELNLRLVQCIYADKLRAAGFGRCTFNLNGACQLFQSKLKCDNAWQYSEQELWQYFAQEILNSGWAKDGCLKFIAFIACTKYDSAGVAASGDISYANIKKHLKAHAALGGGGLALFGSAYFYAWPRNFNEIIRCFNDATKVDVCLLPDDSNYRRTYGGVYATTLGAICHELGHVFDLGHTADGVMGNGFDYVNRVFTINNLTENLPNRIISESTTRSNTIQPRFTLVKKPTNSFLQKYHAQKQNDAFFFSRNCALILAHHKWIRNDIIATDTCIYYVDNYVVLKGESPLKIVEVRRKENSLVENFYEFKDIEAIYRFEVPKEITALLNANTHYLFVMTANGYSMCIGKD